MSAFVISSPSSQRELAQLPAESLLERAHDAIDRRGDLLVRERAVRALEDEPEGQALPPLRDAGALVAVEDVGGDEVRPAALADRREQVPRGEVAVHDHREVAPDERVARPLAVGRPARGRAEERPEVNLEERAGDLELEA